MRLRRRRRPLPPSLRGLPATLAVAGGLVAGACASAPVAPPAAVARTAREASTYSASLRVALRGPDFRARARVLAAFRRPDALRIEVPGAVGARLVAVAREGRLTAVFPADRAVFTGKATPEELQALLGVALSPEEVIDLLVGVASPRLLSYRASWGPSLPRRIEATLPDGGRLTATVDEATLGGEAPPLAFEEPPHAGYRKVSAEEARSLWAGGGRSR